MTHNLTPEFQARTSFVSSGFPSYRYVFQVVWDKDYAGQVTDGKVGTPKVMYAPLAWLPKSQIVLIEKALTSGLKEQDDDN